MVGDADLADVVQRCRAGDLPAVDFAQGLGVLRVAAQLQGQGVIRLWLGTVLMLCASSALEAFVRGDGVRVGSAVGRQLSETFGMAFGILLLLLVFVPLHYLYRIFAYGSPFPMLFLRFLLSISQPIEWMHIKLSNANKEAWSSK